MPKNEELGQEILVLFEVIMKRFQEKQEAAHRYGGNDRHDPNKMIRNFEAGWEAADRSFLDRACEVLTDKIQVSPDIVFLFRKTMESEL